MPSFVWDREPSEAFQEPYEYGAQEQFAREAARVLHELKMHYAQLDRAYAREDESAQKAVWMLQVDTLGALSDSLDLTNSKRHRLASRLYRDIVETMDASFYFFHAGIEAIAPLAKWYRNEVISHRIFRDFIKRYHGNEEFERLRSLYGDLSKYTHRTYRSLLMSYMLDNDNKIAYDGFRRSDDGYVLPHVVAFSYALIGILIKRFISFAIATNQLSTLQSNGLWSNCLEPESVPRRFGNGPGQLMRGPSIRIELEPQ